MGMPLPTDHAGDANGQTESWADAVRAAKRERILEAAARIFADHGLDGASMRRIAAQAGCTTGAIYPLFKNKEAIYAELLSRSLDDLHRRLQAADRAASPEQRLRAGASTIMDFYLERPAEFALSFYLSSGLGRKGVGAGLNSVLNDKLARIARLAEDDLTACVGAERAAAATAGLFAQITGLVVLQLRGRFHVFAGPPQELLQSYLTTVLEKAR